MEVKDMTVEQMEARKAELAEMLDAPDADLDAIEAEDQAEPTPDFEPAPAPAPVEERQEHKAEAEKWTEAINNNTLIMQRLLDKLDGDSRD